MTDDLITGHASDSLGAGNLFRNFVKAAQRLTFIGLAAEGEICLTIARIDEGRRFHRIKRIEMGADSR
jgi:hypothetical protein